MTDLSRRSFIAISTSTLVLGGPSGLARSAEGERDEALCSAVCDQGGARLDQYMCLVGRPLPEEGMLPSATAFRPLELREKMVQGTDGGWYLETGERVMFVPRDRPIRVEVKKVRRVAFDADAPLIPEDCMNPGD